MRNSFSSWPSDISRSVGVCVTLALGALGCLALYANPYRYTNNIGASLPDIGIPAGVLVGGYTALITTMMGWALLVSVLASPGGAAGARVLWKRAVAAQSQVRWAHAVAAALSVAYAYVHVVLCATLEVATLEQYTAGDASTPFQYRALVPWLVGMVHAAPWLSSVSLVWLYGLAEALAAFGAWAAFRYFLRPYVGVAGAGGRSARSAAALTMFFPLMLGTAAPWRHNAWFFPYDTLALAAFALGLGLLQERRWGAYYVLFAVATLNRETTCFLTIAWVLASLGRVPLKTLAAHATAQLAIWVGIKAGLTALYLDNPTLHGASSGLFVNTTVRSTLTLVAVPGWIYTGLALGGAWIVLATLHRRVVAPELRRWFRFVPLFLVGMALVGELLEVRIYGELIPIVTAGLLLALADVAREAVRSVAPSAGDGATSHVWISRPAQPHADPTAQPVALDTAAVERVL